MPMQLVDRICLHQDAFSELTASTRGTRAAKFDNRVSWDNASKKGGFDNKPAWDNWQKKR